MGLAYVLSGSRSGAEDLAQDAFLVVHREWDRIERPHVWVRQVVSNLSRSMIRRRYAEARALTRLTIGTKTTLPPLSEESAEFWGGQGHYRNVKPRCRAQISGRWNGLGDRTAEGTVKKQLAVARRLQLEEDDA